MWSRRQLLWSGAGLCTLGTGAFAAPVAGGKKLLFIYVHGAWDPTYHIDPKLDSSYVEGPEADPSTGEPLDEEAMETVGGHRIATNPGRRPSIIQYFERWGSKTLSVTGVTIGGIAHYPNRLRILTGGTDRARPDLVAIMGAQSEVTEPFGAIDLSGWSFHGPHGAEMSRVGHNWQLRQLLNSSEGLGAGLPSVPDEDHLIEQYLRDRAATWQAAEPTRKWPADLARSIDRLELLRQHRDELSTLFDRNPGNANDNLGLAVDLLAGGWARSVLVDTRYYFDTHSDNSDQHDLNDRLFNSLDQMMAQLEATGQLDDTLVVVTSEMTRSPQQNRVGGKDHWPLVAYLMMGAGVQGGRQLGATDSYLSPLAVDLVTGELDDDGNVPGYNHMFAGVLKLLDLDPEEHMPGVQPLGGLSG